MTTPDRARTPDELFQALASSNAEAVFVPVDVLIETVGKTKAAQLIPITTHQMVHRASALRTIRAHRAEQMLTPEQLQKLFPTEANGNDANNQIAESQNRTE